jgi:transglutaminase-like putative cysteine protease
MQRTVSAHLELTVSEPALLALQVAVATGGARETFDAVGDHGPVAVREVPAPVDGRVHVIDATPGRLVIDYRATVDGALEPPPTSEHDLLALRRPSRYCPSDKLLATAGAEFGGLTDPAAVVAAVVPWVRDRLSYVGGSSGPTDDAVDTLLLREGVCRDYAHLVVSLLRARDVPARLAAVYAPGLSPMDFHAVVEAWVGDPGWQLVDATGLAPRRSMLRIATGRDAADTAFLSVYGGIVDLNAVEVLAVVDELPIEDPTEPLALT